MVITNSTEPPTRLWCDGAARELRFDPAMPHGFLLHNLGRFVRILLRLLHTEDPEVFLHAGLVAHGGRGALVLGAKRAGRPPPCCPRCGPGTGSSATTTSASATTGLDRAGWPRRCPYAATPSPPPGCRATPTGCCTRGVAGTGGRPAGARRGPVDVLVFPASTPPRARTAGRGGRPRPAGGQRAVHGRQARGLPAAALHARGPADRAKLLARAAADVPGYELRQDFTALADGTRELTRCLAGDGPVPESGRWP
ncbi:hypothetical protein NKH77_43665 [Streptomyces sp. M19]